MAQHADELDAIALDFNLDCMFPETAKGIAVMGTPELTNLCRRRCAGQPSSRRACPLLCFQRLSVLHAPGRPAARAADFHNRFPTCRMHTPFDTPAQLPAEWLTANVAAFAPLCCTCSVARAATTTPVSAGNAGLVRRRGRGGVHRILSAPVPGG